MDIWVISALGLSNAAMNVRVPVFVWISVFVSFGCVPRGVMLGHMATLCLTF